MTTPKTTLQTTLKTTPESVLIAAATSRQQATRHQRKQAADRALATATARATAARNSCSRVRTSSSAVQRLAQPIDMTPTPFLDRIRDYVASHGFSRDGAVAAVLSAGPTRRAMSLATRFALFAFGTVTIGCAVGVMLWNDVGPGPLDVFIGGIRQVTGLPLMFAFWVTIAGVLAIATALGRRPGLGSFAGPLIIAPVVQTMAAVLSHVDSPPSLPFQIVVQLLAIAAIGIGAGSMIVSGLGAGSGELLAGAASDRSGRPEARVRMVVEATWLCVGLLLGGPIGWGTVMVALAIGPAVETGTRVMTGALTQIRRTASGALSVALVAA